MKIMIAYATKSGAARECAEIISQQLSGSMVFDLAKDVPNPEDFDIVIIGSGVRMGKIYKPLKKYIKNNLDILSSKKTSIFICNAHPETLPKVVTVNIPERLAASAAQIQSFGGKPPYKSNAEGWLVTASVSDFIKNISE